jgi:hypothetical protein
MTLESIKSTVKNVYFSFPVQLLVLHFRKNQALLAFWVVIAGVISEAFGKNLGIPYLFLDPEYLDKVNFLSFLIVGIAFGGFTMAFHITSYILDSHRFNFLGGLSKPFHRYTLNNSIIPLLVMILYIYKFISFQIEYENADIDDLIGKTVSFIAGVMISVLITFLYFHFTNKDIFKHLTKNVDAKLKRNTLQRVNVMTRLKEAQKNSLQITYYYEFPFLFKEADNSTPYDKQTILKVFDQNQLNAVLLQAIIFGLIFLMGTFQDVPFAQIPAAASGLVFLSMLVMLSGAISYWLREWAFTVVVATLVIFTVFLKRDNSSPTYKAFGLNYETYADYSTEKVKDLCNKTNYYNDKAATIKILENWKAKFDSSEKPKLILMCLSGGGQRSAVWAMRNLQITDSLLNGELMRHTVLITGSSGGMIGAAFYRELYLQNLQGKKRAINDIKYTYNLAKDKLNPMIFTTVVSDLFFNFSHFTIDGQQYYKDRGYALEQKLLRDTDVPLNKKLKEYAEPEQKALIPMMLLAPTIVNDGKKLFISPIGVSYFNGSPSYRDSNTIAQIKGVEFRRFFSKQNADNLQFITALRMSATFPYITPNIELPSIPKMEVVDAGMSDNFGVSNAVHFLYVFRDWIAQNTSGVVVLSIRDSQKEKETRKIPPSSVLNSLVSPLSNLLNNLGNLQDISNDNSIEYARSWFKGEINTVDFQYFRTLDEGGKKKSASLSWRLTSKEREHILSAIYSDYNCEARERLKKLLSADPNNVR